MGLSSSTSKTTSNQSQNTNQTETGTTTPVTPDWLTNAASDYVGRIGSFGNMDPNSFVAPSAPLQNMAWNNASSLGDWRGQAATASQMAAGAGQGGANLAGPGGAMRFAAPGLTPSPQMSGGGSAQMAASQLGGDKMMQHTGNMPLPVDQSQRGSAPNAFSGASSQQPGGYNLGGQGPAYTYNAPNVQSVASPTAYGAAQTSLGGAPQASASGYNAPHLNTPGLVSGQGYSAPQLGQAGGYAAARTGSPIGAAAQGYNPATMSAAQIGQTPGATATNASAGSLLDNLSAYQNPYTDQVRNTALADYDQQAAQSRARLEAQGAATGAFGGSRFGVAQGQLMGDQDRGRATLDAGLLDQGFNTAAGLSQSDAANRQQASIFNAQNQTGVSQFNSGQDAARSLAQAGFGQQAGLANQSAMDSASQFGAGAQNASQLQYADNANRAAMDYSGRQDTASQFGLGQQQQRDLTQAGFQDTANRYGADSSMQANLANQGMQGQFGLAQGQLDANAGQYNAGNAQQSNLANQAMQGQYGLSQFGANTQNAQNYAAAQNQAGLTGYQGNLQQSQLQAQLQAQAASQNATSNNQMSQFNAGQQDTALNRQLQAAGMLGGLANDYGTGTRADLGTMAQLGDQQRGIEQAYSMAGPAQLQLMGQLSGMTPYDILVGRQVNGNSTGTMQGTGTQTTSQTPSLFNSLLQAAGTAAAFIPSDRRVKRGITKIGEMANGLGLYVYRYLWDADDRKQRVGVMADEVARIAPGALGPTVHGFATVNYRRLGLSHLVEA